MCPFTNVILKDAKGTASRDYRKKLLTPCLVNTTKTFALILSNIKNSYNKLEFCDSAPSGIRLCLNQRYPRQR